MKNLIFLFYFINLGCISVFKAEPCHTTTTINPYFRYHKCPTTDVVRICKNCDDYQPSCNVDSECAIGEACCQASCGPTSCFQCQGFSFVENVV
jgi:hypothetical protein